MGGPRVSRKRTLCRVFVAGVLLIAGCAGAKQITEADRLHAQAQYERGVSLLRDGQLASAMPALHRAIAIDPKVATYHNGLGVLYLELRRPDLALEPLKRATDVDASYAEAHLNTGIALAEASRWGEAIVAYRKAIALPTLINPHIAQQNLGLALYHVKRYAEAEEALRFAIGLDPQLEAAFYNLGLVLIAVDRQAEAKLAFRRARELAPNSPFGQAAMERLRELGEGG